MNRIPFVLCSVGCQFGLTCIAPAQADNYAFLVAVGDYDIKQLKPLRYTRNDIFDFRQALLDSGYKAENVVLMHDDLSKLKERRYLPEAEKIRQELGLLLKTLNRDDSVVVAFSGHGVEFQGEDKNYFCPADTDLADRKKLVSLGEVYDKLKACPAQRKLLLVDACRNDPQSALGKGRATVKLESLSRPQSEPIPKGIVALFSCSAGQESYEFPDLKHGIFFHHVLEGWKGAADGGDGQLDLDELVAYTKKQTQTFARLKLASIQTPQQRGEFDGTWYLRTGPVPLPKLITSASTGMKLVLIPAGTFMMGSPASDKDADAEETPQHEVRITKSFFLGQTEVTQGQWKAVIGMEPWRGKTDVKAGSDYPATYISWDDAMTFCEKLSQTEGKEYRLPTEAEWEYACRAGTKTKWSFGDREDEIGGFAWIYNNTGEIGEKYAHPVAQKKANPFGLFDMHGNVYEWCRDVYDEKAYGRRDGVTSDPTVNAGSLRVKRGGSWGYNSRRTRSAYRNYSTGRQKDIGFRVVCVAVRTP